MEFSQVSRLGQRWWLVLALALAACTADEPSRGRPDEGAGDADVAFVCAHEGEVACVGGVHNLCEREGSFLVARIRDCRAEQLACAPELGCVTCEPNETACDGADVVRCRPDGSAYEPTEVCNYAQGETCVSGACVNACELAEREQSYQGCTFYAVDLDNAALGPGLDASAQQYAVIVSNPNAVPVEVSVEANDAAPGAPLVLRTVAQATVVPGDLEVFELPRREVDGSSETGMDDGTGTALTSNAYRVRSTFPVVAYQFNPLDNVEVFSNDASLLLPVPSLANRYTVLGWPQTIADDPDPTRDFDPNRHDEDLHGFLTIVGTGEQTQVRVELGAQVARVLGGGPIPESGPLEVIEATLGPFDTLNLECAGYLADFSGSVVQADQPVAVFVGVEAADVPALPDRRERLCCADHLEEQLIPDSSLGTSFVIARMPDRTRALNRAYAPGGLVTEIDEPQWVRIMAVEPGTTHAVTTLPAPDDQLELAAGEAVTLLASKDFMLRADGRVSVLQAMPSQDATGIGKLDGVSLPGGDPTLVTVPPTEQFRSDYVFLTPDGFAFDFVTIVAAAASEVLLDGEPVSARCEATSVGIADEAFSLILGGNELLAHRCGLSAPELVTEPTFETREGVQQDGVHRVQASAPVGLVVYGFDAFVSYGYPGGLDLEPLL